MSTPPLYFLHIPKTGGMALSSVLRSAYPMHRSLVEARLDDVTDATILRHYDYIDGHLEYLPDHLLQPETLRCTVLRNPIARTISHLFYNQHMLRDKRFEKNLPTLRDYPDEDKEALRRGDFLYVLQADAFRGYYENRQCKSLARIFVGTSIRDSNPAKWMPPADESDFIAAKQQLQSIDFVGLTERLDDTARMIGAAIGLSIKKAPRENVTPKTTGSSASIAAFPPSQQQEILHIIEDINRYDIELYRMAQERFEAQWEAFDQKTTVRMTNRVRIHSITWSIYRLLQHIYRKSIFRYWSRGQLRLLHRMQKIGSANKTTRIQ